MTGPFPHTPGLAETAPLPRSGHGKHPNWSHLTRVNVVSPDTLGRGQPGADCTSFTTTVLTQSVIQIGSDPPESCATTPWVCISPNGLGFGYPVVFHVYIDVYIDIPASGMARAGHQPAQGTRPPSNGAVVGNTAITWLPCFPHVPPSIKSHLGG